jgi:hypothetical protein
MKVAGEGTADDVTVAGDPADIGGAPDVFRFEIEDEPGGELVTRR